MPSLSLLQGTHLSAVTYIHDYFQITSGDYTLSIYAHASVIRDGSRENSRGLKGPGFLVSAIGQEVTLVTETSEQLLLRFGQLVELSVDLLNHDTGPEPVVLHGPDSVSVWKH